MNSQGIPIKLNWWEKIRNFRRMDKTLLEKAKEAKVKRRSRIPVTEEHIELALSWMRCEIGIAQVNIALGLPKEQSNTLYSLAVWLREAYKRGKLNGKP